MNKKYMDFVPAAKLNPTPKVKASAPAKKAPTKLAAQEQMTAKTAITGVEEVSIENIFAERPRPAGVSSGLKETKLGIIEDFQPKFVKTEVSKRPLSSQKTETVKEVKAKKAKLTPKKAAGLESIFEAALKQAEVVDDKKVAKIPRNAKPEKPASPFVNTEKVVKRPLSKNVYQKKEIVAKEEPSGPVTIIAKPEKDSKVGTIVAIIVTIILGATAGTVAFLLLPK